MILNLFKFGLPRPDVVCLLDVPLEVTEALMSERTGKTGGETGTYTRVIARIYNRFMMRMMNW